MPTWTFDDIPDGPDGLLQMRGVGWLEAGSEVTR